MLTSKLIQISFFQLQTIKNCEAKIYKLLMFQTRALIAMFLQVNIMSLHSALLMWLANFNGEYASFTSQ